MHARPVAGRARNLGCRGTFEVIADRRSIGVRVVKWRLRLKNAYTRCSSHRSCSGSTRSLRRAFFTSKFRVPPSFPKSNVGFRRAPITAWASRSSSAAAAATSTTPAAIFWRRASSRSVSSSTRTPTISRRNPPNASNSTIARFFCSRSSINSASSSRHRSAPTSSIA
jgi:hypothetical protein